MTASSPPTRRVVDVIELLVQRRRETTRLSDIVHELKLNQATAYAILTELVEAGWMARDPADKTFSIGAALFNLVEEIGQSPTVAQAAHAAAEMIASETGYDASVSERVADSLIVTAFISGRGGQWCPSVGDRLPFAAPFGPAYAAWEQTSDRQAWIDRSGLRDPAFAAQLENYLEETRSRGFSVERMTPEMVSAIPIMTKLQGDALSASARDHLNAALLEISVLATNSESGVNRRRQYVGAVAAPIFGRSGRTTHNICAHPFAVLSSGQVEGLGRRIRRAADALSGTAH